MFNVKTWCNALKYRQKTRVKAFFPLCPCPSIPYIFQRCIIWMEKENKCISFFNYYWNNVNLRLNKYDIFSFMLMMPMPICTMWNPSLKVFFLFYMCDRALKNNTHKIVCMYVQCTRLYLQCFPYFIFLSYFFFVWFWLSCHNGQKILMFKNPTLCNFFATKIQKCMYICK